MNKIYILSILWLSVSICSVFDTQAQSSDFVTLHGKQFKLNGQDFYPISMNYIIDIARDNQGGFHIAPHHSYFASNFFECLNKQDCFDEVVDDLSAIKNMGFNSIRLVGLGFGAEKDQNGNITTYPAFKSKDTNNNPMIHPITSNYTHMFGFIQQFLDAADLVGLKVQLLAGKRRVDNQLQVPYLAYLQSIAPHFSDNSTLYSYDFMNEPLYFDNGNYSKGDVCNLVEDWHLTIKNNSTYHLTTLGLATSSDVFEWDPGVLKLDFLSFHLYSDDLDVVKSEIKWISEAVRFPWIIGETGYSASFTGLPGEGQGTLQDQRDFAKATLEMTRDCGGSGYSWWMYQDVYWGNPGMGDFLGLVDHQNTPKPASLEFGLFTPDIPGGTCLTPANYYNFYGYNNNSISGTVRDQNNYPIENAIITGRDSNWGNLVKTFSKPNGSFTLYSDSAINIVHVSAIGASVYKNYNASGYLNVSLDQFQPLENISVNNTSIQIGQHQSYEASNSINATNVTIAGNGSTGGDCSMNATRFIKLGTGFSAQKGSYFHAFNASVYPDCGNLTGPNYQKSTTEEAFTGQLITQEQNEFIDIDSNKEDAFKSCPIRIYPNPSSGIFHVSSADNSIIDKIEVYNNLGQKIHEINRKSSHNRIDISANAKGPYLLKVYRAGDVLSSIIMHK